MLLVKKKVKKKNEKLCHPKFESCHFSDQHLRNEGSSDQMNRDLQAENEISSSTSFALASLSFKISITCLPFIFTHVSRKFDFS